MKIIIKQYIQNICYRILHSEQQNPPSHPSFEFKLLQKYNSPMIDNISLQPPSTIDPALFSSLRQSINHLAGQSAELRKQSIKAIYNVVTTSTMSSASFQEISREFLKNVLVSCSDHSEVVREYSIKIVMELMIRAEEVDGVLPYVMSVLVERLNCRDLEGIKSLPEAMRPPPGQKPHVVIKLVEASEEVRLAICKLLEKIIGLVDINLVRRFLDDMVNVLRSLVMDPCGDIQLVACNLLGIFCESYKNILLNYTETMGRAILLPLISKKSKLRVAALNTLNKILLCGIWKFNAFIFQNLIGFKDPNSVAIKQFYEPSLNINYLGSLIVDSNVKVREMFFTSLHFWVCVLDDKYDHHPKLVPYVLSGLFDEEIGIRQAALGILEEIGAQIEKEKHAEFKENIQYGIDSAWTWEGKLKGIKLPDPFTKRPGLGSRFFVKGHVSKMWPALFREIRDINIQHRKKAVNLALMGVIYTEQSMTSHLNKFIPNFITSLRTTSKQDAPIAKKVQQLFYYLGVFCPYSSYIHIIKSGIAGELVQNEQFIQSSFKALAKLMEGSMDAIPEQTGLCHKMKDVSELLNLINEVGLFNEINERNAKEVEELVIVLINGIRTKGSEKERRELFSVHFIDLLKLLMISLYEQQLYSLSSVNAKEVRELDFSPQIMRSLEIVNDLLEEYVGSVQEELESMFANPPSLNEADFKFLIALFVNLIRNGSFTPQVETIVETLSESISLNRLPELCDFFFKLIKSILLSPSNHSQHSLPFLTRILSDTLTNLSKFKSFKKAPVYQQQKQYNPQQLLVSEEYTTLIFKHIVEVFEILQKTSFKGKEDLLATIISGYIDVVNSFKKVKDVGMNSVRPIWALLQRSGRLEVSKFKSGQEYILPKLIDYLLQRIETLESGSQIYFLSIITLSKVFELFPNFSTSLVQLPMHYTEYPSLISKLFKYCLNQKDIESKQKLKQALVVLASKMRLWFEIECKEAQSKGMHERVKLIQQILR